MAGLRQEESHPEVEVLGATVDADVCRGLSTEGLHIKRRRTQEEAR